MPAIRLSIALFGLLVVMLPACSVLTMEPPEETVRKRAIKRLELLMAGDHVAAYDYASPGYRATETPAQYSSRYGGAGMWQDVQIHSVTCGDGTSNPDRAISKCTVGIYITYRAHLMGITNKTYIEEVWININKNWYLYVE